jgi:hypothetical protein
VTGVQTCALPIFIKQTVGETGRVVEELDAVFSLCAEPPLFQAGGSIGKVGVMPASVMAKLQVQQAQSGGTATTTTAAK